MGCLRSDIEFVVSDSSFTSIIGLCEEVAKKQYKLPKFLIKMAFYFIKKKVKKKAKFDLADCNTLNAILNSKYKPSILFLAAKAD